MKWKKAISTVALGTAVVLHVATSQAMWPAAQGSAEGPAFILVSEQSFEVNVTLSELSDDLLMEGETLEATFTFMGRDASLFPDETSTYSIFIDDCDGTVLHDEENIPTDTGTHSANLVYQIETCAEGPCPLQTCVQFIASDGALLEMSWDVDITSDKHLTPDDEAQPASIDIDIIAVEGGQ